MIFPPMFLSGQVESIYLRDETRPGMQWQGFRFMVSRRMVGRSGKCHIEVIFVPIILERELSHTIKIKTCWYKQLGSLWDDH